MFEFNLCLLIVCLSLRPSFIKTQHHSGASGGARDWHNSEPDCYRGALHGQVSHLHRHLPAVNLDGRSHHLRVLNHLHSAAGWTGRSLPPLFGPDPRKHR